MIVTTDIGLSAIRSASAGGFLLNITHFAVSDAVDPTINTDDTSLVGTPVYEALISSIEPVGTNTVKFVMSIPNGIPTSGSVALSEVGLYLASGELFAHGVFEEPFVKDPTFGLNIHVFVTAARLGTTINVTNVETSSLPVINRVSGLPNPVESLASAVIVLDSVKATDTSTASLAIRSGPGGNRWSFNDMHQIYQGQPDGVISQSVISLDLGWYEDAWLNAGEEVVVQAITAGVPGLSRRCIYTKEPYLLTVVDTPFIGLRNDSVLTIWRHNKNVLPLRLSSNAQDYVLLHGQKGVTPPAVATTGSGLQMVKSVVVTSIPSPVGLENAPIDVAFPAFPVSIPVGIGQTLVIASLYAGTLLPNDPAAITNVWLNPADYQVQSGAIRILDRSLIQDCLRLTLIAFLPDPSYSGTLSACTTEYSFVAGRSTFSLPVIASSKSQVLFFVNDVLVPESYWSLVAGGFSVTASYPIVADSVRFIVFVQEDIPSCTPEVVFLQTPVTQANQVFALPGLAPAKQNLICFYGGKITEDFTYVPGGLTLHAPFVPGATLSIYSMSYTELSLTALSRRMNLKDVGPQWVPKETLTQIWYADVAEYNELAELLNKVMATPNTLVYPDNFGYAQTPLPILDYSRHTNSSDWLALKARKNALSGHVGSLLQDSAALQALTDFIYRSATNVSMNSLMKLFSEFDDNIRHVVALRNQVKLTNYDMQIYTLPSYTGPLGTRKELTFTIVFNSQAEALGQINAGSSIKLGTLFSTNTYPADLAAWNTFLNTSVKTTTFNKVSTTVEPSSPLISGDTSFGLSKFLLTTVSYSYTWQYLTSLGVNIRVILSVQATGDGRLVVNLAYDNSEIMSTSYGYYGSSGSSDPITLSPQLAIFVPNALYLNSPHIGFPFIASPVWS